MFIVAITQLATSMDLEAQRLAEDIGVTAYEMRISLMAGLPAIVLTTSDRDLARRALERIVARGNAAVACDDRQVVDSERMVTMRRFRFDPDGARTEESPAEHLPYGDILAILRATHRSRTDTQRVTTDRRFRAGRALLTGGIMMTGTSKRDTTTIVEERESVVYLFRRSAERPWILRQDEAKYQGLGIDMQPTNALNFARSVAKLRELTPGAAFDARLVSIRRIPERNVELDLAGLGSSTMSFTFGVDLLAHLLALYFAQRDAASPYRR